VDQGGTIYVADNSRVHVFAPIVPLLTNPHGVGLDNSIDLAIFLPNQLASPGYLFVADTGNNRVVVMLPDSNPPELLIFYLAGYSSPEDVALSRNSNSFYVADAGNNRIVQQDKDSGDVLNVYGSFSLPYSVAVDADENLYVADLYNNRIVKVATPSGTQTYFYADFFYPIAVALDACLNMYVAGMQQPPHALPLRVLDAAAFLN
jgi:DNA-binding beta-propeller fold protein YncE